MLLQGKRSKAVILLLAAVAVATLAAQACRKNDEPPPPESTLSAELDEYSATVVRTVEDRFGRQVFVTRVARSGAIFREEWSEQGQARALIERPDLGKSFLLFPDARTYVESEAQALAPPVAQAEADSDYFSPDYIDRSFGDTVSPARIETRALADQTVEGYACAVTEQRAVFDDGRKELTRVFRARELAGLAVRVEVESEGVKIITERRDIETRVPPDKFIVPTDFRKVAPPARR